MQWSFVAIIEVWLSGILASLTIILFLVRISLCIPELDLCGLLHTMQPFTSLVLVIFCSISYTLGWIVNHVAECILDPVFQNKFRDKYYREKGVGFFDVRTVVFQFGSENTLNDIKYDRQLIRIARSNSFNFFMLSMAIGAYYCLELIPFPLILFLFLLSLSASIISFFQWRGRYQATYKKFYQFYLLLGGGQKNKIIQI